MVRYFSLNSRPGGRQWLGASALAVVLGVSVSLRAQTPMTPAPSSKPAKPAPVAQNPASKGPMQDTLGRYGKILAPGDDVAHPLKLKLPFPDVGEVKIPSQDEVAMRQKLEPLTELSDADIRLQLQKWPAYNKMSLRDEGAFLQRIQDFRDYRSRVAQQKAHDMGLLTLTPEQKARFEKEYWNKRLQMESDLAKQFGPIFGARQQKLQDDLFREFSSASPGPVAQVAKTPQASGTHKPGTALASAPATNQVQPMGPVAQTPR